MNLLGELRALGWYLSEAGLKKFTTPSENVNEIIKQCLDLDFRDVAEGALAPTIKQRNAGGVNEIIQGPIVLQIQAVRNIAAPKVNEKGYGPRLLCIELSDGQTTAKALELQKVPAIGLNTPPGTKIRFRAEQLQLLGGYLLLKQTDIEILGGHVVQLVEKWELARQMQMYARSGRRPSSSQGGPPAWLAFGKNLTEVAENSDIGKERNFKSLQMATEKDKDNKENEEFNAMRNVAIAEAAKAGTKKVFGGGGQQILDHNIKKILDKGYSEEDARQFLRANNNNLERALFNLKRRNEANKQAGDGIKTVNATSTRSFGSNREVGKRGGGASKADEAAAAKPATNVSLFDFLTDKLPAKAAITATETSKLAVKTAEPLISERNTFNSHGATTQSEQRNQQQRTERQSGGGGRKGAGNSEPRQFVSGSLRPPGNGENKKNEHFERYGNHTNNNGISGASSYNRQNGRGGGNFSVSKNRSSYDSSRQQDKSDEVNNRIGGRNDRNGGNRKIQNSKNSHQQQPQQSSEESHTHLTLRNADSRSKSVNNQTHPQINRNTSRTQGQQQKFDNENIAPPGPQHAIQKQTFNNQRNRPQPSAKQQASTSHSTPRNVSLPANRHQQQEDDYDKPAVVQQPQAAIAATPTLLPNGFVYDPSKIIGFQSKEANEYAMNLMRSQSKPVAINLNSIKGLSQPQQQQSVDIPTPKAQPCQFLSQPIPLPLRLPAAAPVLLPPHHYGLPNPMTAPPPKLNEVWSWKVGDLCMAKYWDDGQYYEAEITGISDKTCVVYFINYGNHEEVLKADCLPITDVHHHPINEYNMHHQMAPPPQQLPPQHQRAPMRYYVPPHKRNN